MKELKELVEDYYDFIINVLTTENELFDNYLDKMSDSDYENYKNRNILDKELLKNIYADILYDFVFNIESIKDNLISATEFFYDDYSKEKTINIYNRIRKIFKDFYVEELGV